MSSSTASNSLVDKSFDEYKVRCLNEDFIETSSDSSSSAEDMKFDS
jgi:hypothetical protein